MRPVAGVEEFLSALNDDGQEPAPLCCALLFSDRDFDGKLASYVNRQFGVLDELTGASLDVFCIMETGHASRRLKVSDIYAIARELSVAVDAMPCAAFFTLAPTRDSGDQLAAGTVVRLTEFFPASATDEQFEAGFRVIGASSDACMTFQDDDRMRRFRKELVSRHARMFPNLANGAADPPARDTRLARMTTVLVFASSALDIAAAVARILAR